MPQSDAMHASLFPLSARHSYMQRLGIALLSWSGVTLLEALQVTLGDASRGYVLPAIHYLAWAAFNWYALALLTPLIYELGRRYPLSGPRGVLNIAFPHSIVCIASFATQAIFCGIAGWLYSQHHDLPTTVSSRASEWVHGRGLLAFAAYWIIVVIASFARFRDEMRRRELHQAQLETQLASSELEKLRMQIQPHFLFNTLQAAITLVQEDPRAAEDVLLRLSGLLRIALDQMDTNEVPLANELEFLDLYAGIQKRRFGDRLSVEIHADPATLALMVPPLILQPLVENAIQHGIGKHKGEDHIEIFARQEDSKLQIEVWNSNSVVEQVGEALFQRGVGLRNTRARLEHLYGPAAAFLFRPFARGGAAAVLVIPARPNPHAETRTTAEAAL